MRVTCFRSLICTCLTISWAWCIASPGVAAINPNQVLVVYNSRGPDQNGNGQADSREIYDYYRANRPGVLGFDLNNATVAPGDIAYSDFITKIRNPLRSYLTSNGLQQQVISFVLTKDLPHRVQDLNIAGAGDSPATMVTLLNQGNASATTVDSELSVLWQNLEVGEANGTMDSSSDNVIANPYHGLTTSISLLSRSQITAAKQFQNIGNAAWRMGQGGSPATAGNIYLPTRLDGNTVADVFGMIDRAQFPSYNQYVDQLLLDENGFREFDNDGLFQNNSIGHLGNDYEETDALVSPKYDSVIFNDDTQFLIGENPAYRGNVVGTVVPGEIALLASYGGNHGDNDDGLFETAFVSSFAGQFAAGAIMNTAESFNGKQFGGLSGFQDQGQLSEFIAAGGTFGVGSAWEPLSFALPDNEALIESFLFRGQTWAEAAWSSIPWLSWQQLVVGDPLAKATLIVDPQSAIWRGNNASSGIRGDGLSWGSFSNWQRDGINDLLFLAGDSVILAPGSTQININLQGDRIVESLTWQAGYRLHGGRLFVRAGNVTVDPNVTATLDGALYTTRGLTKRGLGTLVVNGRTDATVVTEGMLAGAGPFRGLTMMGGTQLAPGPLSSAGVLAVTGNLQLAATSQLVIDLDGTTLGIDSIVVDGTATLAGNVELNFVNNYQTQLTRGTVSELPIVTADDVVGTFASLTKNGQPLALVDEISVADTTSLQHAGDGLFQRLIYDADSVTLSSYLALPGDANGDQLVDFSDLAIWQAHRYSAGTDWTTGDFNLDGLTDGQDFNSWLSNVGRPVAIAHTATIPEPATRQLLIGLLAILGFAGRRVGFAKS